MSTSTDTKLLKLFKWWLREAESNAPTYEVTAFGLCINAANQRVSDELKYILLVEFSDSSYPFGGASVYDYEQSTAKMHLNPERIAFVKAQIERLEKLNV